MVRNLFVVEVPNASDKGMVTILRRPIDSCSLSFESAEDMVLMVFDHIIINVRSFRAALGTGFYVNVRHSYFLTLYICLVTLGVRTFHFLSFWTRVPDFR
jgi:hypothetical protein